LHYYYYAARNLSEPTLDFGQSGLPQFIEVFGRYVNVKEKDAKTWYRILYVRRAETIHVLHCFEKRSNSIEQKDIETAKSRLKRVLEAEREGERNVKEALRRR